MSTNRLVITEEILERVVYGMENQEERLFLDPADGQLKPSEEGDDYIPLPEWGPTDGFRLMDRFVGTLPASLFKERLSSILRSGKGVFRGFKDALKDRQEMEDLWRRYKERQMRGAAISWLGRWSDALALESLGPEPEDWGDLALEEFSLRRSTREDADRIKGFLGGFSELGYMGLSSDMMPPSFGLSDRNSGSVLSEPHQFIAEAPDGGIVGYARVDIGPGMGWNSEKEAILHTVLVDGEYRGLGLGRKLSDMALDHAADEGAVSFAVLTSVVGSDTEAWLVGRGLKPAAVLWRS